MSIDFTQYLGIPFVDNGRDRNGIDCWGLLRLIYQEQFGIELPSFAEDYSNVRDHKGIDRAIQANMEPWIDVDRGQEKVGDGLFLLMLNRPHVGIVCAPNKVLHCELKLGSIVEDYTSARLRNRVLGFYRHRQMI